MSNRTIANSELYDAAEVFLQRHDYRPLAIYNSSFKSRAEHPLVIVAKSEATKDVVVITVLDSTNIRSIPMNGFGNTKKGTTLAAATKRLVKLWMDENPRFDALWISNGNTRCYSHITNINI